MSFEEKQRRLETLWYSVEIEEEQKAPVRQNEIQDDVDDAASIADTDTSCSEHDTDSEQSVDDDEGESSFSLGPVYLGRDQVTEWYAHKPIVPRTRPQKQNICSQLPGVKAIARNADNMVDCWKLFIDDGMISTIVQCTNSKLIQMKARYDPINQHKAGPTDYDEIQAFIGLLYVAGAQRSNNVHINNLWSVENLSSPFYSAVMSQNRFQILYRAIRFDDIETRQERCTTDNLAPIRDLFEKFVQHSVQNYSVSAFITVDTMLDQFTGRCKFRQYISNKPAKYGIKIYAAVDSEMYYTHNLEIYAGRQPDGPWKVPNDAYNVVNRILRHTLNTGRNVT